MKLLERAVAVAYGLAYDLVVEGFPPYEALREEVSELARRSAPRGSVLDVACGAGNVCLRLARAGLGVHGIDPVEHLVAVARRKQRRSGGAGDLTFERRDLAREPIDGGFDVIVSMNTLYWHPDPEALLAACRRALRPGGHAVIVTYARHAGVRAVAGDVRAAAGLLAATRSLRWLVPTALFELLRDFEPRYLTREELCAALDAAGFDVLLERHTFLADLCHLAWARRRE